VGSDALPQFRINLIEACSRGIPLILEKSQPQWGAEISNSNRCQSELMGSN
jgi:hypothetical protein